MITQVYIYDADMLREELNPVTRKPLAYTTPPHKITIDYGQTIKEDKIIEKWHVKDELSRVYEL